MLRLLLRLVTPVVTPVVTLGQDPAQNRGFSAGVCASGAPSGANALHDLLGTIHRGDFQMLSTGPGPHQLTDLRRMAVHDLLCTLNRHKICIFVQDLELISGRAALATLVRVQLAVGTGGPARR